VLGKCLVTPRGASLRVFHIRGRKHAHLQGILVGVCMDKAAGAIWPGEHVYAQGGRSTMAGGACVCPHHASTSARPSQQSQSFCVSVRAAASFNIFQNNRGTLQVFIYVNGCQRAGGLLSARGYPNFCKVQHGEGVSNPPVSLGV